MHKLKEHIVPIAIVAAVATFIVAIAVSLIKADTEEAGDFHIGYAPGEDE